jgi:signal transduction histidine kinase
LATFSNSKPTVLPYVTIFESFWRETELYERAREADKIKDEFVNIAAHELRNPISPIMASAEFAMDEIANLQVKYEADKSALDSLAENIRVITRNAAKLYKLSEDILQVSRIESGTFVLNIEKVDLKMLFEFAVQDAKNKIAASGKNIDIRLDYQLGVARKPDGLSLHCDQSKIQQVLYNLLDNAIKFTGSGTITLHANMFDDTSVVIKIEDSGAGIHPEVKDRLFVKFATKSDGGTGLGLYLVKKIIEAHGGRVWAANNQSGMGASFSFTLPMDLHPTSANDVLATERLKSAEHFETVGDENISNTTGVKEK